MPSHFKKCATPARIDADMPALASATSMVSTFSPVFSRQWQGHANAVVGGQGPRCNHPKQGHTADGFGQLVASAHSGGLTGCKD